MAARHPTLVLILSLLLPACGSSYTLADYAGDVEELVLEMNSDIGRLDDERSAHSLTLEADRQHYEERAAARQRFLDEFAALDPPDEIRALHAEATGIVERLRDAEHAMADRADALVGVGTFADLWSSQEAQVVMQADAKAHQLCHMAQSTFDATEARDMFGDTPWVPPEMKEVILVVLDCDAADE